MKQIFVYFFISLLPLFSYSQNKSKFSVEVNYGLNGNFFVRSYNETGGPSNKTFFYKKKLIGSIAGIETKMKISKTGFLGFAYSRSTNSSEISYSGLFNTVNLAINQFTIRHINNFFQLYYERELYTKRPESKFAGHLGVFYLRPIQQEVELANFINTIVLDERKFKNSNLEEFGLFIGVYYSKKIDTKFDLGIKSRVYYLISTNSFEAITLTPTLTYHF